MSFSSAYPPWPPPPAQAEKRGWKGDVDTRGLRDRSGFGPALPVVTRALAPVAVANRQAESSTFRIARLFPPTRAKRNKLAEARLGTRQEWPT